MGGGQGATGAARPARQGGGEGFSKTRATHVGCSTARNKGPTVCANRLTVRRDILEDTVLSALRERLMDPEVFKACVAGFTEAWNRLLAEASNGAPIGTEVGTHAGRKAGWTQDDRIVMKRNPNYWGGAQPWTIQRKRIWVVFTDPWPGCRASA